jgi:hypothetical protein
VIRPAQDLVPLVDSKFGAGAAFVAVISSIRATFRVLLPLTPLIPMLNNAVRRRGGQGNSSSNSTNSSSSANNSNTTASDQVRAVNSMLMSLSSYYSSVLMP